MTPKEKYEHLCDQIDGITPGKMFGALCMKTANGKAACMFWKDHMVFKVVGDAEIEARSLDGSKTFEPAPGRPMNGWVLVTADYMDRWEEFARASVEYVGSL